MLRDGDYLTTDYAEKADALFDKYHPIEIDQNIPRAEKVEAMNAWWHEHSVLLVASGLNKRDIEKVVTSGWVKLREGFSEFVGFLDKHNIPLVIMSSSGLGSESITSYLRHAGVSYKNIHIICNNYIWDDAGFAVAIKEPIIHVLNKDETAIQGYPVFEVVKNRKNVLLLGDGVDDLGMVQGFDYNYLLTIGFLNDKVEENLNRYKEVFDVVLTNDASILYVNKLLQEVIE